MSDNAFYGYEQENFVEYWSYHKFINVRRDGNSIIISIDDGTKNPIVRIEMTVSEFEEFIGLTVIRLCVFQSKQ